MEKTCVVESVMEVYLIPCGAVDPDGVVPPNVSPQSALEEKTPYFMLHGKDPKYSKLRTTGARVLVHEETYRPKLGPTGREGNLVGHSHDSVA